MDAGAAARQGARRGTATRHLRSRRLGRTDRDDRRSCRRAGLGNARARIGACLRCDAKRLSRSRAGSHRLRGRRVNRFAALLDALLFTPSRNGKLRLMQEYFATAADPERGWALAALTGELVFDTAKPNQVRALAAARVDPELLDLSYDFVGDLAETVSLIWPAAGSAQGHVPVLSEIVEKLRGASRGEVASLLEPWLDALDATGRWALLKLVTGELRIGVSARLAKTALAEWGGVEIDRVEEIWHGLAPPYEALFDWLEGRRPPPDSGDLPTFCPLMLAQP